ncbi:active breakpoint cluster region-related protein-like [Argonauta hians]
MHTSPVNSENIQTKWHGALDAEVKVNVSEIRNKEEFNNINLDLKALEAFTPNRYYKAACIEKTFSFSRTSAEIADPMFTPMVMKSVIDSSDLMHHWKQSYQNLWRSLMDRIIVAEKASLHEMQQLLKCKHFFENIDWPLNTLMSCDEEDAVFFNIDEILTVTSTFVSRIEAMSPGEWVLGTIYNVYYDLVMKHLCLFNSYADNRPKAQQIIDKKGGATVFNEIVDDVLCGFVLAYHPDYSFLYELVIKLSQVPNICQTPDENIIALPLRNGFVVQKVKNTRKLRNVYFKVNQAIHLGVNMVNSVTNTSVIDLRERHFEDCKKALNRVKEDLRIKLLIPRKSRECRITLLFPHLKLIVADVDNQKQYQFLFASYFQLEMWKQMLNDNNYPHSNIHEYFTCINQYCQITRIPDANFSDYLRIVIKNIEFYKQLYLPYLD